MPDIIDDAQAHEAHFLAQALDRAKPTSGPAPDVIDGVVCCAECGEPIPAASRNAWIQGSLMPDIIDDAQAAEALHLEGLRWALGGYSWATW